MAALKDNGDFGSAPHQPDRDLSPVAVAKRLGLDITHMPPRGPLVYFIRKGGRVKIGFTHRLSQRMQAFGDDLVLLGTVSGTTTTERMYHQRFAHLRDDGEWFWIADDLLAAIEAEAEKPEPFLYAMVAEAHIKRSRRNRRSGASPNYAETSVGFWLNMLANGETPERLSGLEESLAAFERCNGPVVSAK